MPPPSSPPSAEPGVVEEARATGTPTPTVKAEPGGGDGGDGALINIKVVSQTAEDVFFRVKRNVKLRRIIDMYCGKHSINPKFAGPDGRFLRAEQTLVEVGLEDGDEISLLLDQEGSGGAPPVHANQICA